MRPSQFYLIYISGLRGGPRIRDGRHLNYYTIYYTFSTFPCDTPPDPSALCIKPAYPHFRSVANNVIIETREVADPDWSPREPRGASGGLKRSFRTLKKEFSTHLTR